MDTFDTFDAAIPDLVDQIVASYRDQEMTHHLGRHHLPCRTEAIEIIELMFSILYPGFHGRQDLSYDNIKYHLGELLLKVTQVLYLQVKESVAYRIEARGGEIDLSTCQDEAREKTLAFFSQLSDIRQMLADDIQALFEGDPAAIDTDEVLLAYPGMFAITIYRLAHALNKLDVPLLPRIMTEYAHSCTGIDIHPGATIGRRFFIDHGTGVVIGETTQIGDNVKLYQGVTLGALSTKGGQVWRGRKRHPTIEDDVTIYANATILGGDTVIGEACEIGGNLFITSSVPPGCIVSMKLPELRYRNRRRRSAKGQSDNKSKNENEPEAT